MHRKQPHAAPVSRGLWSRLPAFGYHPRPCCRAGGARSAHLMTFRTGPAQASARLLVLIVLVTLVAGCGRFNLFGKREDPIETMPVAELYAEAKRSLVAGNYTRAQRYYERLSARFPFGPYTEQAQLELAYAQFKGGRTEEATSTINRFIRTYPAHAEIAYAYYLRGLINFDRESTFLTRRVRLDTTRRDMTASRQSLADFGELIRRYPNSRYAADARDRMIELSHRMAQHEINVATFYLQRGAWVAAQNRGQYVLEQFPESPRTGDALAVISESYVQLGQADLASDARRVLELNDPGHPYLRGGWPAKESAWRKLVPLARARN
jgi:outer membrane protein assembly factor BamD